jgi:hypothetical protein
MICFDRSNPAASQLGVGTGGRPRATHRGTMDTAALTVFVLYLPLLSSAGLSS